jgi:Carboxypeptidase regulatory-like domain
MPGRGALTRTFLALILFAALAHAQTAIVEGTVLNSATRAGVPEVKVTLWTPKGARYDATTDASGSFRIAGVQPGEYRSRYEKPGFAEVDHPGFGQPPLRVGTAGSNRADADLVPFATLRGRVIDPDGKPAGHISIQLGYHDPVETDADGRFELTELRPGTYTLRASPKAGPTTRPAKDRTQIIPTYYPSTTSLAEAERIRIRAGADLPGYEIHLRASPVYRVRGVVLDETGEPVRKANVRLLGPGEDTLLAGRSVTSSPAGIVQSFLNIRGVRNLEATQLSREDGTFEFPSVRPGDWTLEAQLDPQHDGRNNIFVVSSAGVPAPVSDRDLENMELQFAPGFTLEMIADWGDQPPPAGSRMPNVTLIPSTPRLVETLGGKPPDDVLRFEHLLPGRYRIVPTPGLPPGFYPAAVMLGGRNVLRQEVELTPGTPPIRVVYKPNPGGIRGTVEQGEGATVLLWPEGAAIPDIVRAAKADARGAFEVTNVPPGDYSVVAFDRVSDQGGSEFSVLGAVAGGARVKVSEGSAETVELPLTRWPD